MRFDRIVFTLIVFLGLLAGLTVVDTPTQAHPTKKKFRKKSAAAKLLKDTRAKMDTAKSELITGGKYACCIKPACDMCAKISGTCLCAVNVLQGKGACGECLEGWQSGKGSLKGVTAEKVTLLPTPVQPVAAIEVKPEPKIEAKQPEPEVPQVTPEPQAKPATEPATEPAPSHQHLTEARSMLNQAKRTLVAEGRYVCCIKGGCDSCAYEGECGCGEKLVEALNNKKNVTGTPTKKTKDEDGVCGECYDGWHAGRGAYAGIDPAEVKLAPMDSMPSSFALGTMFRQGSGTSWLPENTAMYAKMKEVGDWMLMYHPYAFTTYSNHTGPRGDSKFYSANWFMASAQREVKGLTDNGNGVLMIRGMFSFDPITVGRSGYPLLFQTGETNRGNPLVDRQHPHDLIMELALAYSAPITKNLVLSLYAAPVGEPALGPSAFPHRLSAMDNPEAPLGHHWQDSTHIASGVFTVGLGMEKWKLESSIFTGAEPDENRWNIDQPKFDSWSTRFSVNPHKNLSMQFSYGHLREPEALEAGTNIHRYTASVLYNHPFSNGSYLASAFIWGRNEKRNPRFDGYGTNAFLYEATYVRKEQQSIFWRYENVEKDELFVGEDDERRPARTPVHHDEGNPEIFRINRFTIGGVQNLPIPGDLQIGVGGSISFHAIPSALNPVYGNNPISTNVFVRFRFKRWGLF